MLTIGILFLAIGLYAVEGEHTSFRDVFQTNLIGVALDYIPLIGVILYWRTVVRHHDTSWAGAAAVWLIAWFIPALILSIQFSLFLLPGFIPFFAL
jgi:hypothetical protein